MSKTNLIRNAKTLPKSNVVNTESDIIAVTVKKNITKRGFQIALAVGSSVRVKPSTLQNATVTTAIGVIDMVIVNCYDENGKFIYWIPFECLTDSLTPNQFFNKEVKTIKE